MEKVAKLWRGLRDGGRVGPLSVFVACVLLALMTILFSRLAADIATYRAEQSGVRQLQEVYRALDALQRHRDISVTLTGNDGDAVRSLMAVAAQAGLALQQIDSTLPVKLRESRRWKKVQADWHDIETDGAEWIRFESFRRHAELIEDLLALLVDIADESGLTLDSNIDTFYLQDMLVNRMPALQEYLSRLRAIGTFALARRNMAEETKVIARQMMTETEARLRVQQVGVERLLGALPDQSLAIDDGQAQLQLGVAAMLETLNKEVLSDRFTTSPDDYFATATAHIEIGHQLADNIYQPELARRLDGYINAATRLALAVVIGVVLAVICLALIVREVMGHAASLEAANAQLAEENARRRRTEDELRSAMAQAVNANRAKSEFLANLSHEVRTPLNGILGMAELLAMSDLNEEQVPLLREMTGSGRDLKTMLDRIIDFTHIEAGEVTLAAEPFGLADLLSEMLERFHDAVARKSLTLTLELDPELPVILVGDGRRLRQALECLIDNAVKFTDQGTILVSAHALPNHDKSCALRLSVADTGIGVPADKRDFIFESFTQADGSFTRRAGGSGLGLAIARRLVELMGGHLSVADRPGGGSVFTLTVMLQTFADE